MSEECTRADCPRRQAQGEGTSITSPAFVHKLILIGQIAHGSRTIGLLAEVSGHCFSVKHAK
jgi:hypothetical protein